jgi:hypothetical protein
MNYLWTFYLTRFGRFCRFTARYLNQAASKETKTIMKRKGKETELPFSPVLAAVKLAGGVSKVAGILDVSRPAVYAWIHRGRLVNQKTYDNAAALNRLTGVRVDQILGGIESK